MKEQKLNIKTLKSQFGSALAKFRRYNMLAFIIFVALVYALVLLRIGTLGKAEPSADAVSNQVKSTRLTHIDPVVVKQLEALKDNSVSVQTLFEEARSNPFQD